MAKFIFFTWFDVALVSGGAAVGFILHDRIAAIYSKVVAAIKSI
jgi:hypothetical protein